MADQDPHEVWQVEVGGQVYEAAFFELGEWIGEGALHPEDKVRKGNLRWIEARRVPSLVPFFNAKQKGLPLPVIVSTTDASAITPAPEVISTSHVNADAAHVFDTATTFNPQIADPVEHSIAVPAEPQTAPLNPNFCAIHADVPTVFLCDGCANGFCKVCPKAYGGSVRICPFCGAMCRALSEVRLKQTQSTLRTTAVAEGFGMADFFNALAHPFKFKASLVFGALFFMALTLGQGASAIGGMYMMVGSIFCVMLSNMLTFGVLANTIDSFAHGNLDANFMPEFENFELWDDVIHPFFLSIGAYISSFGPFILVLIVGFYLIVSSVSSQMNEFQQKVEKIPGSHTYDTQRTLEQSEDVKSVLGDISDEQAERVGELENFSEETAEEMVARGKQAALDEMREQEELWEMAQNSRRQSLEGALGKSPETQAKESEAMLQSFLGLAAPLVVIGAIFFLWGVFYFPAACAVAGYTRSFSAAINPLVGLDTIKRLGGSYALILLMGLVLVIASAIVSGIAGALFSAVDLPGFGNLPATAIGALFGFYLWIVFSCVLGYAMFKKSDKLNLQS